MWGCVIEVTKLAVQDGTVVHWREKRRGGHDQVHVLYVVLLTANNSNNKFIMHSGLVAFKWKQAHHLDTYKKKKLLSTPK